MERERKRNSWGIATSKGPQICLVEGIFRNKLFLASTLAFALASAPALASVFHPANVPSARVHVNADGSVDLHVRFDILAFCLEETPQEISDRPMNALLDGPTSELQNRLADAQNRFRGGLSVIADDGAASLQGVQFPNVQDVENCARENGAQRLPVMLTVVVKEQLPASAKTISCRFPDVLGSVVVTTEMPYEEPVSEPVDPGDASTPLQIPSAPQVAQAAQSLGIASTTAPTTVNTPNGVIEKTAPSVKLLRAAPSKDSPQRVSETARSLSNAKESTAQNTSPDGPALQAAAKTMGERAGKISRIGTPVPEKVVAAPSTIQNAQPVQSFTVEQLHSPPTMPTPSGRPAWYLMFGKYIKMGYKHILPQGLDHILFVLGLFLLSRKTKPLLTQISCFTIAHSITLGLSLYGVFSLPSSIVEPLIAASIVFVAVENLFTSEMKAWRPFIVFGFGLVHGLGFAGALKDAGLARGDFLTGLVGFNCGVELGQLSVVALAFLAVGWLRSKPSYRLAVVMPASIAIALVAAFWTIQRIF